MEAVLHALSLLARPAGRAAAVVDWNTYDCMVDSDSPGGGVATIQCLMPMFENVVRAVFSLSGVILFIMLISGGFSLLTSGGDPKKLEGAKRTMTYAILGIVLIASAYLIMLTIQTFTGVDVLRFEIPAYEE